MASGASINTVNSYYRGILRFTPPANLASVFANQLDAGTLTTTQLQNQLLSSAQSSSVPALVTYDLLFNSTPGTSGVDYLTTYASNLQSGNYTYSSTGVFSQGTAPGQYNSIQFSLQNVFVNLGATFASSPNSTFAATYGSLDRGTFINQIYAQIFGTGPAASTQTFLLNNFAYYASYAGSELGGRGAITGLLLSVATANNLGPYPAAANALLSASAVSQVSGSDTASYGSELVASYGAATTNNTALTTGADTLVASAFTGDLTPFLINGKGPTLNVGDQLSGLAGTTNNVLTITDQFATGADVIPAGVSIKGIQTINLATQGNAGASNSVGGVSSSGVFDTTTSTGTSLGTTGSTISGVTAVNVLSAGQGVDNVRVDPGSVSSVAVTVNHQHVGGAGGVKVLGGNTVTVTDGDGTGVAGAGVTIGTVNSVGLNGASLNPTGAVSVVEIGNNFVTTFGGTTTNITASGGGAITVGSPNNNFIGYPADEPTKSVTISANGGVQAGAIAVYAASPVTTAGVTTANTVTATINETSLLANAIVVGAVTQTGNVFASYSPAGSEVITVAAKTPVFFDYTTSTQTGLGPNPKFPVLSAAPFVLTKIETFGGSTVNIATNANSVAVGGTFLNGLTAVVNENPTGDVVVTDTAVVGLKQVDSAGGASVSVFGGRNVSISNAGGAVNVGGFGFQNPLIVVAPTGTETVTNTAPVLFDNVFNKAADRAVTTLGGTTVAVSTNAGSVTVGTKEGTAGSEPTGAVTVTDTASSGVVGPDGIAIYGGTTVTATSANGSITIGNGSTKSNPSGNVSSTVSGVETGGIFGSAITVNGGVNVTANTTGGNVTVGKATTPITGVVVVNDTFAGTQSADTITVVGGAQPLGGAAVTVNTTKTSGTITVGGVLPIQDATGTAITNLSSFANGNVTIVNETVANTGVAGATNLYGTGATAVAANGATTVSITGGGAATVTDVQTTLANGGVNAGKAIGLSTLATVVLDRAEGPSTITSDALNNLTIIDDVGGNAYTVVETPAHALVLTVGNDAVFGKTTTVADKSASSLVVTDNGVATAGKVAIAASSATSATFTTKAALSLDLTGSGSLATITLANAASIALGDLTANTAAITAGTASTGAISASVNGNASSFSSAGSGNDTITLNSNNVTKTIQAGLGATNTIVANYAAAGSDTPLVSAVKGFNTLGLGANAVSAGGAAYDATGFSSLTVGAVAGAVTISNVGAGESLAITASPGSAVTLTQNKTAAANTPVQNSFAITDGVDGPSGTGAGVGTAGLTSTVNLVNTANVSILSRGQGGSTSNKLTLNDLGSTPLNLSVAGDESLTLTGVTTNGVGAADASATTISTQPASRNTVDLTGIAAANAGISVAGGAGQVLAVGAGVSAAGVVTGLDTAAAGTPVFTQAKDSFVSGAGGGAFTLGTGGGYNPFLPVTLANPPGTFNGAFDTGYEQVNLSGSTAKSDTINLTRDSIATFGGKNGGITGFQATASTTADLLNFDVKNSGPYSVLANNAAGSVFDFTKGATPGTAGGIASALDPSGQLANTLANISFSSSNGVITVVANGTSQPPSIDTALKAAEIIVALAATKAGVGQTAALSDGAGNNYVVAASGGNTFSSFTSKQGAAFNSADPGLSVVELLGTPAVTGFGAIGATGAVVTNAVNVNAANNGSAATTKAYNDAGFSLDTLTTGRAVGQVTTFNNLGTAAQINVAAGGVQVGGITTTQVGAVGNNSLVVDLLGGDTVSNLVASGDYAINLKVDSAATVSTVTDATASVTSLLITGASTLTVGSLANFGALTSVDAGKDTGALTLGVLTPVTIANLLIKGALGGDTLFANGINNTISVGSAGIANSVTGPVFITAAGNADVISLVNQSGNISQLTLGGVGDKISVDTGFNKIAGGFDPLGNLTQAVGAGATVNLADGGNDTVWVGINSTVNLIGNAGNTAVVANATRAFGTTAGSTATVQVTGDVAGTTSAGFSAGGSGVVTTINGADLLGTGANSGSLGIKFLNKATDLSILAEGLAGGSSTSALINIQGAPSFAAALDAAVNQSMTLDQQLGGGATSVLNGVLQLNGKTGLISAFQYTGNTYVIEAINAGSGAAAHAGFQASDEVIRLAGLVDLTKGGGYNVGTHTLNVA